MTRELGKRYPNIYRVLIAERNVVMAKNLFAIMKNYPEDTIVAVMGAGHVDEVKKNAQKCPSKLLKSINHQKYP